MLQYRPTDDNKVSRDFYSPARDVAYCGINIIRAGLENLDNLIASDNAKELVMYNITTEELDDAASKLAIALNNIDKMDSKTALKNSGFSDVRLSVQNVILANIGLALIDATFYAVKDVSTPENGPPPSIKEAREELLNYINNQQSQTIRKISFNINKAAIKVKGVIGTIKRKIGQFFNESGDISDFVL